MRVLSHVISAALAVGLIAESAYLVKSRREVKALTEQVHQLSAELLVADLAPPPPPRTPERAAPPERAPRAPAASAPPRFVTAPVTAPSGVPPGGPALPAALDTPEGREELRRAVATEVEREREEQVARLQAEWQEQRRQRLRTIVRALALDGEGERRLAEIVTAGQEARRELFYKFESGGMTRGEMTTQLASLRAHDDQQLRQALGDDGIKRFRELERQERRGGGETARATPAPPVR